MHRFRAPNPPVMATGCRVWDPIDDLGCTSATQVWCAAEDLELVGLLVESHRTGATGRPRQRMGYWDQPAATRPALDGQV